MIKAYPHPATGNPVLEVPGNTDVGSYHGFAIASYQGKTYISFGDYWEGTLPPNWIHKPLLVIPQA